jgi:hypothetical protein
MWLVVRSLKNANNKIVSLPYQDYKISNKDIMKLGRVKFKVKDLKSEFGIADDDDLLQDAVDVELA